MAARARAGGIHVPGPARHRPALPARHEALAQHHQRGQTLPLRPPAQQV